MAQEYRINEGKACEEIMEKFRGRGGGGEGSAQIELKEGRDWEEDDEEERKKRTKMLKCEG